MESFDGETDSIPEETEEKSAILCTKAVVDDPSETIIPDQSYQEPDRIDLLESGIKTCRDRLDGFGQELKVLFVEINIISKFIQDQFGIELIDRATQLREHIHDFDELEELTKSLSTNLAYVRRSNRQATSKWAKEVERRERLQRRKKRYYRDGGDDLYEVFPNRDETSLVESDDEENADLKVDYESSEDHVSFSERNTRLSSQSLSDNKVPRASQKKRTKTSTSCRRKQQLKKLPNLPSEDDDEGKKGASECEETTVPKKRARSRRLRRFLDDESVCIEGPKRLPGRPKKSPVEKLNQNSEKTPRQCDECGKILKGPGSLKSHMNMHADVRPYPCPEEGCGKRFRVRNKLNLHMMIHTGDKKEQCRFCGKLFYFAKDLARHERTHTGEKPFKCDLCEKSFNVKQHLTLHRRIHTGERPYTCPTCQKRFSQANSLRIHKKIHVKAAQKDAAANTTKKSRAATLPSKPKTRNRGASTAVSSGTENHIIRVHNEDEYENIVTVVIPEGTTLDASQILEIHQAETSKHAHKLENNESGSQPSQLNQVQLITVHSQDTQILESNQERWKLSGTNQQDGGVVGSPLGTVQIPIYGYSIQQNRLPVIANTNDVVLEERRRSLEQSTTQFHPDTTIQYFTDTEHPQ